MRWTTVVWEIRRVSIHHLITSSWNRKESLCFMIHWRWSSIVGSTGNHSIRPYTRNTDEMVFMSIIPWGSLPHRSPNHWSVEIEFTLWNQFYLSQISILKFVAVGLPLRSSMMISHAVIHSQKGFYETLI